MKSSLASVDPLTRLLGTPHPYLRLGTGSLARAGVGPLAALLDRAARAGMAVPPGIVLLDAAWHLAQREGLVQVDAAAVATADPQRLLRALGLWPVHSSPLSAHERIVLRSALPSADVGTCSLAGDAFSRMPVDPHEPAALAAAICDFWSAALREPADRRRDLLLMKMVAAKHVGLAYTERSYEDDLIACVEGNAAGRLTGTDGSECMTLVKLRPYERMPQTLVFASRDARVQEVLRILRLVFGAGDWVVEWADDGRRCWLLQFRSMEHSPGRDEVFLLAGRGEQLPALPSAYVSSLIAAQATTLFAYVRQFDHELPADRPLVEIVAGRPLINLTLLCETMRAWGLPTRLVTAGLSVPVERDYASNLARMSHKWLVLLRQGLAQLGAPQAVRADIRHMHRLAAQPINSFSSASQTLGTIYSVLARRTLALNAALILPLALLRRSGTLAAHSQRQQTIATEMNSDRAILQAVALRRNVVAELARGELPADAEFQAAWQTYLGKYGHRGGYESDIARPRLREEPHQLLKDLARPAVTPAPLPPRGLRGWLMWPIWWQAARAIRARDELHDAAMRDIERLRGALLTLAAAAVARGALPEREALWLLSSEEAARLDAGWIPDPDFFAQRQAERERLAACHLPPTLRRSDMEHFL